MGKSFIRKDDRRYQHKVVVRTPVLYKWLGVWVGDEGEIEIHVEKTGEGGDIVIGSGFRTVTDARRRVNDLVADERESYGA